MKDPGKPITLTVDEMEDPKKVATVAHRSCTPVYDGKKIIGYTFSGWTESEMKRQDADAKKKKK